MKDRKATSRSRGTEASRACRAVAVTGVLVGLLGPLAGCSHDEPGPAPTPSSTAVTRPASVESARAAASPRIDALPGAPDVAAERAYLLADEGSSLLVQHRAALELLDAESTEACGAVLGHLAAVPPDQVVSAAAGAPDPVTGGLFTQEGAALRQVLAGCDRQDESTVGRLSEARRTLGETAGAVDLRLEALGVTR